MKAKTVVSEQEIQLALNKFLRQGGLIRRLPDQIVTPNLLVGGRWGMFEPVSDKTGVGSGSNS